MENALEVRGVIVQVLILYYVARYERRNTVRSSSERQTWHSTSCSRAVTTVRRVYNAVLKWCSSFLFPTLLSLSLSLSLFAVYDSTPRSPFHSLTQGALRPQIACATRRPTHPAAHFSVRTCASGPGSATRFRPKPIETSEVLSQSLPNRFSATSLNSAPIICHVKVNLKY
ncbi:hypothetical protein K503DRAFT_274911 [Rhizopogon vinicolor AM-OR11-026]|uniref:Uncharacterized protein n=1 Tax=Rhizopogon vinicolor AM-OR11-026 TaxID=1314800 RepID=A0A1B7NDE9_9AGAM|nr:hypothetical protein K503DRAFT_274911 [Rhizopogon vinicolor AM-OR11-026]